MVLEMDIAGSNNNWDDRLELGLAREEDVRETTGMVNDCLFFQRSSLKGIKAIRGRGRGRQQWWGGGRDRLLEG
jgi:hypothetical protein